MNYDYYRVRYRDVVLAERMSLECALVFVEALFMKFYGETDAQYTIEREQNEECCCAEEAK